MSNIQAIHVAEKPEPRKVKNNCSVFRFPYTWKSWYGFWHNIKELGYIIRAIKDRAVKGHCNCDVWNCGDSIEDYLVNILTEYRNNTYGWPDGEFATFEDWVAYIDEIIDLLEYARQDPEDLSEYHELWVERVLERYDTEQTEWDKELNKKYYEDVREISTKQKEALQKAFAMLSEHLKEIWW
jgi:hypothetical protein